MTWYAKIANTFYGIFTGAFWDSFVYKSDDLVPWDARSDGNWQTKNPKTWKTKNS